MTTFNPQAADLALNEYFPDNSEAFKLCAKSVLKLAVDKTYQEYSQIVQNVIKVYSKKLLTLEV